MSVAGILALNAIDGPSVIPAHKWWMWQGSNSLQITREKQSRDRKRRKIRRVFQLVSAIMGDPELSTRQRGSESAPAGADSRRMGPRSSQTREMCEAAGVPLVIQFTPVAAQSPRPEITARSRPVAGTRVDLQPDRPRLRHTVHVGLDPLDFAGVEKFAPVVAKQVQATLQKQK